MIMRIARMMAACSFAVESAARGRTDVHDCPGLLLVGSPL